MNALIAPDCLFKWQFMAFPIVQKKHLNLLAMLFVRNFLMNYWVRSKLTKQSNTRFFFLLLAQDHLD